MTISLLHPLLAGIAVAAATIPIILHLLLRQQPKRIVFPALRLLRDRHQRTVQKLRLRQWLLLAARILLFLLLGLALARPTLRSAFLPLDQKAPVHAMIIVDTSLSMQYKERGQTRLDAAKQSARSVLEQLPEGSEIVVLDSAAPVTMAGVDVSRGVARLESLSAEISPRVLNDAIATAYRGLAKSQLERKEVYVFTDMAQSAWNLSDPVELEQSANLVPGGASVYVVPVTAEKNENVALSVPNLSQQILAKEAELKLELQITNAGAGADYAVELSLDGQPRDNKAIHLPAGQTNKLSFSLTGLEEGLHQGQVAVNAEDPLVFDNVRYFTIEVRPPLKNLVIADRPEDAIFWANALAPEELKRRQRARFAVDVVPTSRLGTVDFSAYSVVTMINVSTLSAENWEKLSQFVQAGGGLFVALGERVDPVAYDTAPAQAVLAGRLGDEVRAPDGVALAVDRFTHPVLSRFKDLGTAELADLPVLRYYKVEPTGSDALVLARYSDGGSALLERSFGKGKRGRSLLLTTAAHYRPTADTWSELPRGWSFLVLAEQTLLYLGGATEVHLNFRAGEAITVDLEPAQAGGNFAITDPNGEFERISADPNETVLTVPSPKFLGNYRVDSGDAARPLTRRFSVNEPADESNLVAIPADQVRQFLGPERTRIAKDPSEIERVVGEARVGRELFPWLMLLVLVLVFAEGYLANRFYREPAAVVAKAADPPSGRHAGASPG